MTTNFAKYRPLLLAALAVLVLPFGLYLLGLSLNTGTMVVALAIAAMGLNLCIGYTGLVSFGHGAWFGIGAYAAAIMTTQGGMPLIAALGVAIVLCFAIGWILGYPALRVQHHYLAFVTLAFQMLIHSTILSWVSLTGGDQGLRGGRRRHRDAEGV